MMTARHNAPERADGTRSDAIPESERLALYRRKAELEVSIGLNLQSGQPVLIRAETGHKPYVDLLVEACRAKGCGWIEFDWDDIPAQRKLLLSGSIEEISRIRPEMVALYQRWRNEGGARIALDGDEFPGLLDDTDPEKRALFNQARRAERSPYYNEVAAKDLSQWIVAPLPMPGWADRVFPELPQERRFDALLRAVERCMRLDAENPVEAWREHLENLRRRSEALNALRLRELHFTGPDTDLRVRLSELATFHSGSGVSANGVPFVANLPTEEVFTTPDWRGTSGSVRMTRPIVINDELVSGLQLRFKDGEIVEFSAASGLGAFAAQIAVEPGAKRLGEVAIVGTDSRIYQTGRVFQNTLFDENAASHIAIGEAYATCIEGGTTMQPAELDRIGFNKSPTVHYDMMISDDRVDVTGLTAGGKMVAILRSGAWVLPFQS